MKNSIEYYHVHSMFSNGAAQPDSTMFIRDYAEEYRRRGNKVLCLSEHGNRSDVWEQFNITEEFKSEKDSKGNPQEPYEMIPLAAAEAYFVPDRFAEIDGKKDNRNFHLILVAKNMDGYYQLNEAMSEANLTGFYNRARVDFDILSKLNYKNFICTTACIAGPVRDENYERLTCQLHEIFRENFYLEIQHHHHEKQIEINTKILRLYGKYHWPLIYGSDSHYIRKQDKTLRAELLLSKGINYGDEDSFVLDLPTVDEAFEMLQTQGVFVKARIEEAMENTLIFREFEGVKFDRAKKIPNSRPDMPLDRRNYLYKKECCDGYIARAGMPTKEEAAEIHAEMDAVADTGTADYFILCKDILDLARKKGGVVTPTGRGSASSFATCYSLGFTTVNRLHCPIKLYPERFISRERMAAGIVPDCDINLTNLEAFEAAGKEILGEYGCLPMIQYGTTKTLAAFKLLAKARDIDPTTANEVSKQIKNYEMDVKHALDNNADDPDYNVDDEIQIESYVEDKYLQLIEDSKQYQGIVLTIGPHPCGHLLLDKDIRREIGVIRTKDGYAAYIDGTTADAYGFLKLDFLRVSVIEIISRTFRAIGKDVMPVNELLETVKNDKDVWALYANGFTNGLNQCEQPKSTQRVMRYKPRNVVELSSFVAAIRPGFRSMLETFISRTPFSYGIPSLDNLLKTKEIPDSFLMYDEQVLSILIAAGIPAADAYVCLKGIKKKKLDKVKHFKEQFEVGYTKYLKDSEGASDEAAKDVVENVWGIILASANYLFNASHSFCMACDSLYVAWLKAHYWFELYATMLKIWDEKKKKDKIAAVITEMKRYKNISLTAGEFGKDNTDWLIDKENNTISQSVSSVKGLSKNVAADLARIGKLQEYVCGIETIPAQMNDDGKILTKKIKKELKEYDKALADKIEAGEIEQEDALKRYDEKKAELYKELEDKKYWATETLYMSHYAKLNTFVDVLRAFQMDSRVDAGHIKTLISIGYFHMFGGEIKLMKIFNEFNNGKNKLTKTIKSFEQRLQALREYEESLKNESSPLYTRLANENENMGICITTNPNEHPMVYLVSDIDEKYGTTITLYSIQSGRTGTVRFRKADLERQPVAKNQVIRILDGDRSKKYTYKGGVRTPIPGEQEYWVRKYKILRAG